MSKEFGVPLETVLAWPYSKYLMYLAWLRMDVSRPSRSDYYTMGVSAEVRRILYSLAGEKKSISLEDFLIKVSTAPQATALTKEEMAQASKAVWLGLFGLKETADKSGVEKIDLGPIERK